MRVIYIDLLFVTNLIPDYLLLRLTAVLLGRYVRQWRLILGAIVAAACALPLLDGVKMAELESAPLAISGDDAYFHDCFIPGILTLGGVEGCLAMTECEVVRF